MDKAKLMKQFGQILDEIELKEKCAKSFYEFESESVGLLKELSHDVMEDAIGKAGKDYRIKKHDKLLRST